MREKSKGIWQQTTWQETARYRALLRSRSGGARVSGRRRMLVLGDNRPRLYVGMLAAGALGGYAMPAFPDATRMRSATSFTKRGARFALAEDQEQVDKILDLREQGATIEHIVYDDPRGLAAYANPGLISWDALAGNGRGAARPQSGPARRADRPRTAGRTRRCSCIRRAPPASPRAWCCRIATCSPACETPIAPARSASARRSWPICRWPGSATSR